MRMREIIKEPKSYEKPTIVDYGDIRVLTSAVSAYPGQIDSIYYMGHIIHFGTEPDVVGIQSFESDDIYS